MNVAEIKQLADEIKININEVIVGQEATIDHLLIALIASGHVLLEDVPGTGKTLLARTLAQSLALDWKRIQFTPDLLPSDITGINFYNQKQGEFEFRAGPLFTNIVLADEINRATPRTQSSLLEAMEERQVTIDGETHPLSPPFMVIATQNPLETQGTFPLPEAQLDRFLIRAHLGYPSREEGIAIMKRFKAASPLTDIIPVATHEAILSAQALYADVYVSDAIYQYMMDLVEQTRTHEQVVLGISPRGSQALLKAVQVKAILAGRDYVIPDDIKAMLAPVFGHRLILKHGMNVKANQIDVVLAQIMNAVTVPTEDLTRKD